MTFFESLLALLFVAIVLLQISRRLGLPYPAMLAAAGVIVALVPGTPTIVIDANIALTLFIAPAIVDAAYDFAPRTARRLWGPLVALAIVAVVVTTSLVAWMATAFLGLPVAAAIALGAIVSPPDAAAATAVLGNISIPRTTDAVIKGESLFNDATALLIFSAALAIQSHGGLDPGVATRIAIAAPAGVLLGIVFALAYGRVSRFVEGTLGGNLLQFVNTFLIWIVATRLGLSNAALATFAGASGPAVENLRYTYAIERDASAEPAQPLASNRRRDLGLTAIRAERETLDECADFRIGSDGYLMLQEELDWRELTLLTDDDRQIEES